MAVQYSFGRIITDGLVLSLNAADRNSYPGSGTTWTDMSGNGNNGTLTNGPTFSSANGGSIVFDGVDDYVNCGGQKVNNTAFTFAVWVRPSSISGTQVIVSQGSSAAGSYQYLAVRNNLFQSSNDGSATFAESNATPAINTWYYLVGVYNPSIVNKSVLYVNSILQSTSSPASAVFTGDTTSIARSPFGTGSAFFSGIISNVLIYNKALTTQEVLQNYDAQKSRYGL